MTLKAKALKPSRLRREILAMSKDMHKIGIMNDATYRKITMRDVDKAEAATPAPLMCRNWNAARNVRPARRSLCSM